MYVCAYILTLTAEINCVLIFLWSIYIIWGDIENITLSQVLSKNLQTNSANYSAVCYARNPSLKYFYAANGVRLQICARDDFYFTLIFRIKILLQ